MKSIFIFLFSFLFSFAYSFDPDNGNAKGKVMDAKTGELLPGVVVFVEGTSIGTSTDMDGNFMLKNIPTGSHSVTFRFVGYTSKSITDVNIKKGETTSLEITLESSQNELTEVVVTATVNKETSTALLLQQKNSTSVSDGISSETIKRTPDKTTSDVIKRVSGASIQENKFAIIRGLNDRYNSAYINGAPLPSSESDRKAFAFDIFPAALLDNLIIIKSATPDLPGDFAGGIIQINTKSIPEENSQNISVSSGYNSFTTFKAFKSYSRGKWDWMGLDDGSRALSSAIPNSEEYKKITDRAQLAEHAKNMNYDWSFTTQNAPPPVSLQYSTANHFKLFKKDLGLLVGLTYQNTPNIQFQERKEFDNNDKGSIVTTSFQDTIYSKNILSSALVNLSYNLNERNQISAKNILSVNSDDKVTFRAGARNANDPEPYFEKSSVKWFTQNILNSTQVSGEHLILQKQKLKFDWVGGYSRIKRSIPALLRNVYRYDYNIQKYVAVVADNTDPQGAGNMFFSNTNENIYSFKYNLSKGIEIKKLGISIEAKIGGYHQYRDRIFDVRNFKFTPYKKGSSIKFNTQLLLLPEDEIFAQENMGVLSNADAPYNGGFKLTELTKVSDSYFASSTLHAGYGMVDARFLKTHRIIMGARIESYQQRFNYTEEGSNIKRAEDTTIVDILPSVNYIFSATEKINIRASYYKTVSRPEFRELAPFAFYNFLQMNIWSGDPKLKRGIIHNYDLRFEYYPTGNQLISVTGFYKDFTNPIEAVQRTAVSGDPELYYANVPHVTNVGAELEYRLNLGLFTKNDSNIFLNNTTVFTNFSYIESKVDVGNIIGAEKRPLQGQSPYIVNAGAQFLHPTNGFGMAISYNLVGPRIFVVGNVQEPNVWEWQRHIVDFQISKRFFKNKLEVKINAKDILAQSQIFYQDMNKDKKATAEKDDYTLQIKYAPTYSFGISYRF